MKNLGHLRAELLLASPLAKAKLLERISDPEETAKIDALLTRVIAEALLENSFGDYTTFTLADYLFNSVLKKLSK